MRYQLKAKVMITVTGGSDVLNEFEKAIQRIHAGTGGQITTEIKSTRMDHIPEDQT